MCRRPALWLEMRVANGRVTQSPRMGVGMRQFATNRNTFLVAHLPAGRFSVLTSDFCPPTSDSRPPLALGERGRG